MGNGGRMEKNDIIKSKTLSENIQKEDDKLESSLSLEQSYQEAMALSIQSKHDQVARIEDRLEDSIERQQGQLQSLLSKQPGTFTMPKAKRDWQTKRASKLAQLQKLHGRLNIVRDIKENMGVKSPKIEELATRKLRIDSPELASSWDLMRESVRRKQAEDVKKRKERSLAIKVKKSRSQLLNIPNT